MYTAPKTASKNNTNFDKKFSGNPCNYRKLVVKSMLYAYANYGIAMPKIRCVVNTGKGEWLPVAAMRKGEAKGYEIHAGAW